MTGWVQGLPPDGFQANVRPSSIDANQIILKAKQQLQHEKGGVKDLHQVASGSEVSASYCQPLANSCVASAFDSLHEDTYV